MIKSKKTKQSKKELLESLTLFEKDYSVDVWDCKDYIAIQTSATSEIREKNAILLANWLNRWIGKQIKD